MNKKLFALVLIIVLAAALAACGGTDTEAAAEEDPAAESAAEAALTDVQPFSGAIEPQLLLKNELAEADDVTPLYGALTITGTVLPMGFVFSRQDLDTLAEYGAAAPELAGLTVTAMLDGQELFGLDLHKLLELCGDDLSQEQRINARALGCETKEAFSADAPALLVLAADGEPVATCDLILNGAYISGVDRLLAGSCCDDPHYEMHNRPPHDGSADAAFTFNIYEGGAPLRTVTYTTAELEALALAHPEAVWGSYYGVIGDKDSIPTMGAGGFLDYYEGLLFNWLLTEELGLTLSGRAELYGREGELYAEIADLGYFAQDEAAYYSCTGQGAVISGLARPVLAYSKNGAPLLPEHDHESPAYISGNILKDALKELGLDPQVGTVKNHSGPFVAALGNCAGFYGGYQTETAGDCVRMDIYVD